MQTLKQIEAKLLLMQKLVNQEIDKLRQELSELTAVQQQQNQQPLSCHTVRPLWQSVNFNLVDEKEWRRTFARRKLEWLAQELNKGKERIERWCYITDEGTIDYEVLGSLALGQIYFNEEEDAKYALSQMTEKELNALREQ
jgi:hypothetical protein